ncbi:hypothetical protein OTU49_011098 [Cherax quadricarinatus]|uniref:SERTA domain-containing protein n=1 Tax=Cherax quadricarinatus TaxID=27406 RepID=A0AAW0W6I5_CHEQU
MYRIVFLFFICFIVVLQRLENQREDRLKEQRDKIHCLVYERQTALESWYQTLIHQIYGREPYKPSEQCSESWINVPILSSMAHSSCLMDEIMTLKNTLQKMSLSQEERGMPWLQDVGLMALFLALFFIYFVWTDDEERLPEDEEESLHEDAEERLPEDDEEYMIFRMSMIKLNETYDYESCLQRFVHVRNILRKIQRENYNTVFDDECLSWDNAACVS